MQITPEILDNASEFDFTFNYLIKGKCWECGINGVLYPYKHVLLVGRHKDEFIIVSACDTHLVPIKKYFEINSVIELSLQDIFYLKCK